MHQAVWKSTTCAVKTLFANDRMSAVDKAKMQDSFQREAALLCHLRHPNIVNVLAVSLAELTLVMEFYPKSLVDLVQRHKNEGLPRPLLLRVAQGIARGMHYLHTLPTPVIHRDLKPANILLEDNDNPRVGDFGISREDDGDDSTMTKIGTPLYSAPEILNDRVYTTKVDVYSFGILLWECITGTKPYSSPGQPKGHRLLAAVADGSLRPPVPDGCDPALARLMVACWDTDPDARPSFEDIATHLLPRA